MSRPVAVLVAAAALVAVVMCAGVGVAAGATTWDVYPGEGTPIQDAIDGAAEGDTIYVHAGMYVENVDVWKQVTLRGDGADVVTVRAMDKNDYVFEVTVSWVNISGFAVAGATDRYNVAGIYLINADNCNISDNTASNNRHGIRLDYSSNNTLASNTASNNGDDGICLQYSNENTLTGNTASNNGCGICMLVSSNNTLASNIANPNNMRGISLGGSGNNTLASNTASDNGHGAIISHSSNNTLVDNTASNNGQGILLQFSSNNMIMSNTANSNGYGISLRGSNNNNNNNNIYHNNLAGNTNCNAYDKHANQWDSGSAGKYYSDYTGIDNNTDDIGDTPYLIPGGSSTDRFPLMQPWTPLQKGDLNGDGFITPTDAVIALVIAAGGSASCNPATFAAADMNDNHRVTSLDALMIMQTAAGAIAL